MFPCIGPGYARELGQHSPNDAGTLTGALDADLADRAGIDILPGIANFLLCHLPTSGPDANSVVAACRERGLFLRDVAGMGTRLGERGIRIAVKDRETNERMAAILGDVLGDAIAHSLGNGLARPAGIQH